MASASDNVCYFYLNTNQITQQHSWNVFLENFPCYVDQLRPYFTHLNSHLMGFIHHHHTTHHPSSEQFLFLHFYQLLQERTHPLQCQQEIPFSTPSNFNGNRGRPMQNEDKAQQQQPRSVSNLERFYPFGKASVSFCMNLMDLKRRLCTQMAWEFYNTAGNLA